MRRIHVRGENPRPDEEGAAPRQARVEQPIVVKKIEAQLSPNASHQDSPHHCEPSEPVPSPTMPPLEDPDFWLGYGEFGTVETFLPVEIRAKVVQTFLHLDQRPTAPPDVIGLAENSTIRREPNGEIRQQPDQNNGSSPPTVNMNSCTNTTQQKIEPRDPITGSQLRDKRSKKTSGI